ncbi:MAG: M12 family metallo-peptidase, partial [Saprospiraceae bacterium]
MNRLFYTPTHHISLWTLCWFFIFFFGQLIFAQNYKPIAESIHIAQSDHKDFQKIEIFQNIQYNQSFIDNDHRPIKNLIYLDLNLDQAQSLFNNKPDRISIQFPLPDNKIVELLLEKQDLFDSQSKITTQDDVVGIPLTGGCYYRGIIKDDFESFAAISFFENEVIGVLSNNELGNIVIGKQIAINNQIEQLTHHVIYQESTLPIKNPFQCGVSDTNIKFSYINHNSGVAESVFPNKCKAIKVFLECTNRLYTDKGSTGAVQAYMTGVFNVVKALYANEQVNLEISEIMVWTTADPYLKTTLPDIIYDYANRRKNNFNGTLAQLVTTFPIQQQGGIAFVDGMCKTWDGQTGPLSFAYVYNQFSTLPTYSWSVEVMAHEMGHNFGSWHTHSCVWGPSKNAQIDNCQPADVGSCNNGVTPVGGGTVMSYCHLTSVGINFSKGFGPEPGDILRNAFATKNCIPSSFIPIASHSIKGPYFEGDSIRLVAKPYNKIYKYEWLHYDYILNKVSDTTIKIGSSGIYKLAISNINCTEYSTPDTIKFNAILVNLGCPIIPGKKDSFFQEISIQVDNPSYTTDSLIFPTGLYSQIPNDAI